MTVVLLSGGTGGAKLARGLYELLGADLAVIANTGDDIEIHGGYVSPDPDLITYWLADRIDERGWGIAGDSFAVMEMMATIGVDVWFSLGDRDLAVCLERRRLLDAGVSLTDSLALLARALGVSARILPMCEEPVRTRISSDGRWLDLQAFLIRMRGAGTIEGVEYVGSERSAMTEAVATAVAEADAVIIGPSNPVLSIAPILAVPGLRDALADGPAPVVAVSPVVGGAVLKGPTAACMSWAGQTADGAGVAAFYGDLLDGFVADESVSGVRSLRCETMMSSPHARRELAERTLEFANSL